MSGSNCGAVLCIGGMDSSGGAGLLRDCATLSEMGVTARVAVTAVTAQSDRAVTALEPMPPDLVAAQIAAAGQGGSISAVKIGMLGTAELVSAVAETLATRLPEVPVVLDPVLAASSGRALLDTEGRFSLIAELVPQLRLITPNLPELIALGRMLGVQVGAETGGTEAACVAALRQRGCGAVLVKGGHSADPKISEDRLYRGEAPSLRFPAARIDVSLRGTGCQLASAVAAYLALGAPLDAAVSAAKSQVLQRFQRASGAVVAG